MNNCRLPQRSYSSPLNSKFLFAGGRNFCEAASKYYPSTTQKLSFRPHQLSTRYGPGFNQTSTLFFQGAWVHPKDVQQVRSGGKLQNKTFGMVLNLKKWRSIPKTTNSARGSKELAEPHEAPHVWVRISTQRHASFRAWWRLLRMRWNTLAKWSLEARHR